MTSQPLPHSEELLNFLVERATVGISDERQHELDNLLRAQHCDDIAMFEHAASFVELAFIEHYYEPMPNHLRLRLIAKVAS